MSTERIEVLQKIAKALKGEMEEIKPNTRDYFYDLIDQLEIEGQENERHKVIKNIGKILRGKPKEIELYVGGLNDLINEFAEKLCDYVGLILAERDFNCEGYIGNDIRQAIGNYFSKNIKEGEYEGEEKVTEEKSQNIDTSACPDNLASNLKMIEGVEKVVRKVMEIEKRRIAAANTIS